MATPITLAAGIFEAVKLVRGEAGAPVEVVPLVVGLVAALISGLLAIHLLLRYLRTNSLMVFVVYRVVLAAIVIVAVLR